MGSIQGYDQWRMESLLKYVFKSLNRGAVQGLTVQVRGVAKALFPFVQIEDPSLSILGLYTEGSWILPAVLENQTEKNMEMEWKRGLHSGLRGLRQLLSGLGLPRTSNGEHRGAFGSLVQSPKYSLLT